MSYMNTNINTNTHKIFDHYHSPIYIIFTIRFPHYCIIRLLLPVLLPIFIRIIIIIIATPIFIFVLTAVPTNSSSC